MHIMHGGKCFHLKEGLHTGAALSAAETHRVEKRVCASHKSHSIWAEGEQRWPEGTQNGQALPELSINLFYVSSLFLFTVLTELEGGHEVKGAFAYHTLRTFHVH